MLRIKWTTVGLWLVAMVGSSADAQSSNNADTIFNRTSQRPVAIAMVDSTRPTTVSDSVDVQRRRDILHSAVHGNLAIRDYGAPNRHASLSNDRFGLTSGQDTGCDASKFKAAEARRGTGSVLTLGGLILAAVGAYKLARYNGEGSYVPSAAIAGSGLLAGFIGQSMMSSTVSPRDFDNAVQSVKTGTTKLTDVTQCMGTPKSKTTDGDTQTAIYTSKDLKSLRTVVFTAKAGIVSDVHRSESRRN